MNNPMYTNPGMPAFQTRKQVAKTRPAIPAAMKRKGTLIFKMPIEEREEQEVGRYSILNPEWR